RAYDQTQKIRATAKKVRMPQ
nr:3B [potamipivirus A1]